MVTPSNRVPLFGGLRLVWLRACCGVAEGADITRTMICDTTSQVGSLPPVSAEEKTKVAATTFLRAILGDPRIGVLGGVVELPRSLASVLGGAVARFLERGISNNDKHMRVIRSADTRPVGNNIAVHSNGSSLLLFDDTSKTLLELSIADGSRLRVITGFHGESYPCHHFGQVFVADDGFVFITNRFEHHIHILFPDLRHHCVVGVGRESHPTGVVANVDVIVVVCQHKTRYVSAWNRHVVVLNRRDGSVLRRFGGGGSDDGQLNRPRGVCFMSNNASIAVADGGNNRISMFTIGGGFIRHIGVGVLKRPKSVACSAANELVVSDIDKWCLWVFSDRGELLMSLGHGQFTGVCIHRSMVFAVREDYYSIVVFS